MYIKRAREMMKCNAMICKLYPKLMYFDIPPPCGVKLVVCDVAHAGVYEGTAGGWSGCQVTALTAVFTL